MRIIDWSSDVCSSDLPVLLPAGMMPINHNLVVVSGLPAATLIKMLNHPDVQRQAEVQSLRLENGYRSFTATLLRRLIIPTEAMQRSEERSVGKECISPCSSRWSPYH